MFDAVYHTYDRVRASTILFTAVLAASARFFRPDLAENLHSRADTLILRAVLGGLHDLQLVQAILVLVYWKRTPDDRTAYVRIGLACRLLCELRIAFPTPHLMNPMSDEEERRQVDSERTMYSELSPEDNNQPFLFYFADPPLPDACCQ